MIAGRGEGGQSPGDPAQQVAAEKAVEEVGGGEKEGERRCRRKESPHGSEKNARSSLSPIFPLEKGEDYYLGPTPNKKQ